MPERRTYLPTYRHTYLRVNLPVYLPTYLNTYHLASEDMVGESCTCEWLSERLVSSGGDDGVLLLDCRSVDEYKTSHVQGSIHVTVPSIVMRRLRVGSVAVATVVGSNERKRFTDRWKSDPIVLYDGGASDAEAPSSREHQHPTQQQEVTVVPNGTRSEVVSLLMVRLRTDGCSVYYLQGKTDSMLPSM